MKIGIEAQRIFRLKKHGMDIYALEFIKALQKIDTVNEYFIYVHPDEDPNCLKETGNFKIRLIEGSYPLWEQKSLPAAAKKDGVQLLHCTSNTAPIYVSVPLVITLHDIIYLEKSIFKIITGSGTNYQKFGNVYRRLIVPILVKKCKKIFTVSNYESCRIANFFKLPTTKIQAYYNGVSPHFKRVIDSNELNRIKTKYNLPDRFFLFLANTDPKKNTKGVLEALSLYYKKGGEKLPLVLIDLDRTYVERILVELHEERLIDKIIITDYVLNKDLPAVYSLATIFLYPSLRESFGIPMLEAMSCGVPVITSTTSSMPEVAQDAALLVDPYKPELITEAMFELVNNTTLQDTLVEKGYLRAAQFTWHSVAEQMLNEYTNLINNTNK